MMVKKKPTLLIPSKWMVLFVLAVLIPSGLLVIIGLQALKDGRLIIEKKFEQEALKKADTLVDTVNGIFLRAEEKLRQEVQKAETHGGHIIELADYLKDITIADGMVGHYFIADSTGKLILPQVSPLYLVQNKLPRKGEAESSHFMENARDVELKEHAYSRAALAYDEAFRDSTKTLDKAESLAGAARCYFKGGQFEKAVSAYEKLAKLYPDLTNSAGFPFGFIAGYQTSRALPHLSKFDEALKESILSYQSLVNRRWKLTKEQYLYLAGLNKDQIQRLLPSSDSQQMLSLFKGLNAREEQDLALTRFYDHYESFFLERIMKDPEGSLRRESQKETTIKVIPGSNENIVYIRIEDKHTGSLKGIAGFSINLDNLRSKLLSSQLKKMSSEDEVVAAIFDNTGKVIATGGKLPSKGPTASKTIGRYFPQWHVQIFHPHPEAYTRMIALRRRIYTAILVPLFIIIIFGLFFLAAGIKKEVKLARMKTDFVSTVSHELKSPLSAIRMLGETLQMGRVVSPKQRKRYYDLISRETERLTQLIDNILDFSNMEGGRKKYIFSKCDLTRVVRETVKLFHHVVFREGYQITIDADDALPEVEIDSDAISQAVLNLLSNAVKFSKENKSINVTIRCKDKDAVIEVEDKGVGIEEEEIDKIFTKFYRAGDALTRETRGSGLGLAIVRHVVQAHGGRVEVKSKKGAGSTFALVLPIVQPISRNAGS